MKGVNMKKLILIVSLSCFSFLSLNASTVAVFECKLLDGKKLDEVKEMNQKWLDAVNELSGSKITSQVLQPVVSSDMDGFMFIDTYPDAAVWGKVRNEISNGAIQAIDDEFDSISKCNSISLYDSELQE